MPCDSVVLRFELSRDRFDLMQDELLEVRSLLPDEICMYRDAVKQIVSTVSTFSVVRGTTT